MSAPTVRIECEFLFETDNAMLVEVEGGETIWLPFSQVESIEGEKVRGRSIGVVVSRWIAERKGLA